MMATDGVFGIHVSDYRNVSVNTTSDAIDHTPGGNFQAEAKPDGLETIITSKIVCDMIKIA